MSVQLSRSYSYIRPLSDISAVSTVKSVRADFAEMHQIIQKVSNKSKLQKSIFIKLIQLGKKVQDWSKSSRGGRDAVVLSQSTPFDKALYQLLKKQGWIYQQCCKGGNVSLFTESQTSSFVRIHFRPTALSKSNNRGKLFGEFEQQLLKLLRVLVDPTQNQRGNTMFRGVQLAFNELGGDYSHVDETLLEAFRLLLDGRSTTPSLSSQASDGIDSSRSSYSNITINSFISDSSSESESESESDISIQRNQSLSDERKNTLLCQDEGFETTVVRSSEDAGAVVTINPEETKIPEETDSVVARNSEETDAIVVRAFEPMKVPEVTSVAVPVLQRQVVAPIKRQIGLVCVSRLPKQLSSKSVSEVRYANKRAGTWYSSSSKPQGTDDIPQGIQSMIDGMLAG